MTATSQQPRRKKTYWPRIPSGFVRAVLAGHSALGLVFAALLFLVCLSGSLSVFAREFLRWESPNAPVLHQVDGAAVQNAMEQVIARSEAAPEHIFVTLPAPEIPRLILTTDIAGEHRNWIADGEGNVVAEGKDPFTEFLTHLHINLHLPRSWGEFLVGLSGVALLSLLISGILAHPRIFRDAFHFRRGGGSVRLQEADVHNRLGVWAMPFHILISLTGALLGLTTLIVGVLALALFQGDVNKAYSLFLSPTPADDPRAAPPPELVAAFATLEREAPDGHPVYMLLEHPLERGQSVSINTRYPNRLASVDSYVLDGRGKVLDRNVHAETTVGEKLLNSLGPLHFGWFGGGIVKVAYFLLGLALTVLTATGITIWLARRREKGRPAPGWEKIWTGWVWSQPLAIALAGLATLTGSGGHVLPLIVWGVTSLIVLGAAMVLPPAVTARGARVSAGATMILLGIGHLTINAIPGDAIAVTVDLVLVAGGLAMLVPALRAGAEPAAT
ncbi:PepSY-associated TM helix domain-containing protein [Stakelama tenebrarum]|uniref:PepSY domain-containing protein n=1 Tax=Stakelama tenebrarum TaxID=2711215 RepID=A0A6G6Y1C7_9SPHN|nr:PepSY-associated TM helix domain-containing protein [Sphingosinithalassobacter tenebrarum]QIG78376.1 PepSY domain-containing protein [Sphingosinithalassobacter tenebrarum]